MYRLSVERARVRYTSVGATASEIDSITAISLERNCSDVGWYPGVADFSRLAGDASDLPRNASTRPDQQFFFLAANSRSALQT